MTARTMASFGYEWQSFDDVRQEDERFAGHYLRDLDLSRLHGRLGLDAGCGKGRYSRFLAPALGALVALDGSEAARVAARNLRAFDNVVVVRSDLRLAPFADESFGFIACLGVLHHLQDPREGFDRLARLLGPDGLMLLYLYSRPSDPGIRRGALAVATLLRRFTTRLRPQVLRPLCVPLSAVLYVMMVLPGRVGERLRVPVLVGLPMSTYRDKPVRSLTLDTFDRLSAPVEHRFVWSELAAWFEESGLVVESARDEAGWFITARRPVG